MPLPGLYESADFVDMMVAHNQLGSGYDDSLFNTVGGGYSSTYTCSFSEDIADGYGHGYGHGICGGGGYGHGDGDGRANGNGGSGGTTTNEVV